MLTDSSSQSSFIIFVKQILIVQNEYLVSCWSSKQIDLNNWHKNFEDFNIFSKKFTNWRNLVKYKLKDNFFKKNIRTFTVWF